MRLTSGDRDQPGGAMLGQAIPANESMINDDIKADDWSIAMDTRQCEPVHYLAGETGRSPEKGIALCLSGGGYRAMLYHTGVLWRLFDIGLLAKIDRISSVSGGSITAGVMALNWRSLFESRTGSFEELIVGPIRRLASVTIDIPSVIKGLFWFGNVGMNVAGAYKKHLFGDATLQDITDVPRFVFNATNLQSGAIWRFSKPYMRDYRVGEIKDPLTPLSVAVAASSAFPPVLSPLTLSLDPGAFTPGSGTDLSGDEYRRSVVLTDGGVYDNLGLETAWKRYSTVIVSDAGGGFFADPKPHNDWLRHMLRVLFTIDHQVRSLRTRQVVESLSAKIRDGAYFSIRADMANDYPVPSFVSCDFSRTGELAGVPTRLSRLDPIIQERLINWGYVACDSALRTFYDRRIAMAEAFPFPGSAV